MELWQKKPLVHKNVITAVPLSRTARVLRGEAEIDQIPRGVQHARLTNYDVVSEYSLRNITPTAAQFDKLANKPDQFVLRDVTTNEMYMLLPRSIQYMYECVSDEEGGQLDIWQDEIVESVKLGKLVKTFPRKMRVVIRKLGEIEFPPDEKTINVQAWVTGHDDVVEFEALVRDVDRIPRKAVATLTLEIKK